MVAILTIILGFILFLIIVEKCWFVTSPVSLCIVIIFSLMIGYIVANVLVFVLEEIAKTALIFAIVALIVFLIFKKNDKS